MKDRIKKFMDYKSISAGELATILDVQRSNISHVLNGRNMPGASFIEKFLISFPDLNARWLITGSGEMINTVSVTNSEQPEEVDTPKTTDAPLIEKAPQYHQEKKQQSDRPVEKIIMLFSDGTFTDYMKR